MKLRLLIAAITLALPHPACAQERDFCASRPGLGTPACTMAPGTLMVETGIAGWEHTRDSSSAEDNVTLGDFLLRLGVSDRTELQLGFGGWQHQRVHDSTGVSSGHGIGDILLGFRHGLAGPNGPVAVQGFITLPTGTGTATAGDWGAGLLLSAGKNLPGGFEIDVTPEIDAAVNGSGKGRHLAWGGVLGLSHPLGQSVSLTGELAAFRDQDPDGASTDARAALSLAWQAGRNVQFDLEADAGLANGAPRRALLVGFARRF
ncbi:MAG: transporter [Sphingomonadales bacterium]|nr:transporter [Sphingomonadales bacterium]